MATTLSLTRVRADLYKIVDRVLETGTPVEIERRGKRVRIIPVTPPSKLDNLVKHPGTIVGNPEDVVQLDWSSERSEGRKARKGRKRS